MFKIQVVPRKHSQTASTKDPHLASFFTKSLVKLTQEEMASNTKEGTQRSERFAGEQRIFVCGGFDGKTRLNSVESYSWLDRVWTLGPAMKEARSGASAFVRSRKIYISGGWNGTESSVSIERLNADEEQSPEWVKFPVKMPVKCKEHKMVCHGSSSIITGGLDHGDNVSNAIYKIWLNPPSKELLTKMPEPRCCHGCEIIDNQVIVTGGSTSNCFKDAKNTVYACDLDSKKCKTLKPLPFAVSDMATVSYKDNVILIGGANEKGETLNSVVMYNVKKEVAETLPPLNHKRVGSAAVITAENVIIVMGGHDFQTETYLDSVEYLDLGTKDPEWKELSPMTTKRSAATAVMKPIY